MTAYGRGAAQHPNARNRTVIDRLIKSEGERSVELLVSLRLSTHWRITRLGSPNNFYDYPSIPLLWSTSTLHLEAKTYTSMSKSPDQSDPSNPSADFSSAVV